MEQVREFFQAKGNHVSDKISQTIKFSLGAAATTGLVWLTNYPAITATATSLGIYLAATFIDSDKLKENGLFPIFRGMMVVAVVLSSAHFVKILETANTNLDYLKAFAFQGLPIGLSFAMLSLMTKRSDTFDFITKL